MMYLTELNLVHNAITSLQPQRTFFFSPQVLSMTYLTELDLAHNAITSLPPQLKYFHENLTAMDLSYNRLSSLPLDLMSVSCIHTLGTYRNTLRNTEGTNCIFLACRWISCQFLKCFCIHTHTHTHTHTQVPDASGRVLV
jgi:Leucine-rich repeat (LRR) protein